MNEQHLKISIIILTLLSYLTLLVASEDETMCYLKNSECDTCYSLCSNEKIIPDYIKECLIEEKDIDLELNTIEFKNNITIIFLLEISVDNLNTCSLSSVKIVENYEYQDNFYISIRSEYLRDNLTFPILYKNSHATLLNAEFYFSNIYHVEIERINFHGNIIRYTPTLSFYNVSNSFIEDSIFYNATISENDGAAILIEDNSFTTINNTYFRENEVLDDVVEEWSRGGGAIYLTENSVLECYNCSFFSNDAGCSLQGGKGGAIWLGYQSEIKFCENCIFVNNKARDGGAVQLSHNSVFSNCYNCIFDDNHGYDTGGAVSATEYSILTMIINSTFINNKEFKDTKETTYYGGGAVFLEKNSIFSYSEQCIFENNTSTVYGGAIEISVNSTYCNSAHCIFIRNRAEKYGGAISVHEYSIYSNSSNCIFEDNFSKDGGAIYLVLRSFYENCPYCFFYHNQAKNDGGAIHIFENSVYSNSPYCIFNTNIALNDGGAIWIDNYSSYSNSENVNFTNNSAPYGGAILLTIYSIYSNCSYSIFEYNKASKIGGAICIENFSHYFNSANCIFSKNTAEECGAICILQNSKYNKSPYCIFDSNFAKYYGGAIFIEEESTYQDSSNCEFINNVAGYSGGALSLEEISLYNNSPNSVFINNQAAFVGGAIFIYNSEYEYSENNSFFENSAENGGALYIYELSNYADSGNCLFYSNTVLQNGGAMLLSDNSSYSSSPNTTFISNFAKIYGGGIAFEKNKESMINLEDFYFENNTAESGGAFYSDLSSSLKILETLFINNVASIGKGGALYFDEIEHESFVEVETELKNCLFTKNSAIDNEGGSIFFKSDIYEQNITIENCSFEYSEALTGGAISLQNVEFLTLINNIFVFNEAKLEGGSIYCELLGFFSNYEEETLIEMLSPKTYKIIIYSKYEIQDPFIIANNLFYQNQAQEVGGAISLDFEQSEENITNKFYRIHLNLTEEENITVLDESFRFVNNTFYNNMANYGGAAIRINGFNISNIINHAANGSCIKTQRIIEENNNIFTNNTSPLYKEFTPENFELYEYINESEILCSCIYGERLDQNLKNKAYFCEKCGQNTYMNEYYDNLTDNKSCIECPQGFVCPGGYENLKLKENFWSNTNLTVMGNDQSIEAFSCDSDYEKKNTCLGYNKCYPNNINCSKDSVCLINYMGPACQVCNEKLGYYFAGENSCLECESNKKIALKMLGTVTIILILLLISIDSTKGKIEKQLIIKSLRIGFDQIIVDRDELTALMRIFTNYFENISYFFLLSVEVPDSIKELFFFIKSIGEPLTAFTNSFECLLSNLTIEGLTKKQEYLLLEFIWSLSLPTAIVLLLYLGGYAIKKIFKAKIDNPFYFFIAPIYIYLYLEFLPTLFYNSLSFLTCRTIAGKEYIIADSEYECDEPEYGITSITSFGIALPIFLFELLVPILLVCILVKFQKKNLLNRPVKISSCKYQLGYFYLGYKESCYFWEFLRICERLMIASTFLVFYDYSSEKGALVVLTLFLYFISSNYFKPNDNNIVEGAEFYSNSVEILTFLSAILLQKITYNWFEYLFVIAFSLANIIFILYMCHIMLKNARIKFIILFTRHKLFRRFKFVRDIIERRKQERVIVKKWINLKRELGDILKLGCENVEEIIQEKESIKNNLEIEKEKLLLVERVQTVQGYQLFSEEAEEEETSSLNKIIITSNNTEHTHIWSKKLYSESGIN